MSNKRFRLGCSALIIDFIWFRNWITVFPWQIWPSRKPRFLFHLSKFRISGARKYLHPKERKYGHFERSNFILFSLAYGSYEVSRLPLAATFFPNFSRKGWHLYVLVLCTGADSLVCGKFKNCWVLARNEKYNCARRKYCGASFYFDVLLIVLSVTPLFWFCSACLILDLQHRTRFLPAML